MKREDRFDLCRALAALDADPLAPSWRASYERAVSDENAARYGVDPQPGRVYLDLFATRDMTVAGVSGSNYLVSTSDYGRFFGSLQGASIAFRLGAQALTLSQENALIPAINTAPTTAWLADENTAISTSQPVIGACSATPKAVAALVTASHQLIRQGGAAVEAILTSELTRAIAAAVDDAIFNGTGTLGQPEGILANSAVQSASGASIAWSSITDMIEDTTTAGAAMVSPGFATTGAVREILMGKEVAASSGILFTQDARRLAGFPFEAAKSGPAGAIVFADWSDVYVPTWGLVEIQVDPFSGFKTGKVSLRAILQVDVMIAHPSAIAARTSVS